MKVTIFAQNGTIGDEISIAQTTDKFMTFVVKEDQPLAKHPPGTRLNAFDFRLGEHAQRPPDVNERIVATVISVKENGKGTVVVELKLKD